MKTLIIEDDSDVRLSIEQILTDAGFLVDSVGNGDEGIYRAHNWEYDAIILDVMLPGHDGWDVLASIRARKRTPVIMLTALGQLTARRRSFGQRNNVIDLGRVQIDLGAKTVFRDGQPIALSAAEYRILVYLALRAGTVVSANEIMDAVNDDNHDADSNVLKVQIYQIRKKIDKNLIVTRRNLGYMVSTA